MDQQPTPQPTQQPQTSPQAPKHGPNKGLIFGIIGGVALLFIILIVVIIAVISGGGASKADYQQAISFKNAANTAQGKILNTYVTPTQDQSVADKNVATLKEQNEAFQKAYKSLENSKAVKDDSKLAELFQPVKSKKSKLDNYVLTVNEFAEKVYPVAVNVRKKVESADNEKDPGAWKDYASKLKAVQGELKSDTNKEYVEGLISDLNDIASVAGKVSAGEKDFDDYDKDAVSKYGDAYVALQNDNNDYSAKMTSLRTESQLTSELSGMGSYLSNK